MGHIKEPKGVDFIIASDPLTDKARQEISAFICDYKDKAVLKKKNSSRTASVKRLKAVNK